MTDLAMTAQAELLQEVEAFLAADPGLAPARTPDERFASLVAYQKRLHARGLAVPAWPVELGGRGIGAADAAAVSMALGRGGAPELINFVGTDVLAPALLRFGRPDDVRAWMPAMAAADEIWCQMFSEPDAGSDLTNLRTRAIRLDDGSFEVTGQKVWSTWAHFAHHGLLLARTGTQASRHRGITAFVVEMDSPGLDVRPLVTMTGAAEFAEVHLDGVRLPAEAVLGEVDGGWAVAQVILNAERGPYAVRRASVIARCLADALAAARKRPAGADVRRRLIEAYTAYWLLEARIRQAVAEMAEGRQPGVESALTKLLMTQAEQAVFAVRAELLGPAAMAWDDPEAAIVAEEYLYSRAASIYGGSSQIQRNIIGERLLGLPREPSPPAADRLEPGTEVR